MFFHASLVATRETMPEGAPGQVATIRTLFRELRELLRARRAASVLCEDEGSKSADGLAARCA